MAVLKYIVPVAVLLAAAPAHGHHMGRTVPVGFAGEVPVYLAAVVITSYIQEQMGRQVELSDMTAVADCYRAILEREAPMAVVPDPGKEAVPAGIVIIQPGLNTGRTSVVLVMGARAREKLEFSLVPKYMEKLSETLSVEDWKKGAERMEAGEGVRGVALDMLRDKDLL